MHTNSSPDDEYFMWQHLNSATYQYSDEEILRIYTESEIIGNTELQEIREIIG